MYTIEKIKQILKSEATLIEHINTELPPRLSFMTDERRVENVKTNLTYMLRRLEKQEIVNK